MLISKEDMAAFFNEMKNGTYKCQFCGNEAFIGNNVGDSVATLLISAATDIGAPSVGNHPFISFSCTNCGNTTFFHRNQFNAWHARKKAT